MINMQNNKELKDAIREQNVSNTNMPVCSFKGCNKFLSPVEAYNGKMCLHHSLVMKNSPYKCRYFKFDWQQKIYVKIREYNLTLDEYLSYIELENTAITPGYLYEFISNGTTTKLLYSSSPNLIK